MRGPTRSAGRERCPTCGAPRCGEACCHRCKSDLGPLIRLERRADGLRAEAQRCYARGWYRRAAALAAEAASLERSPENLSLLACACLMAGDFPAAVSAYRRKKVSG